MPYATSTLWAAVQWLNGREIAPAHRHTSQAVRFIIDGAGSYSTVEGDKVFLERGDLVLTPPWMWHDQAAVRRAGDLDGRARHPAQQLPRRELLRELPARQPARRQAPQRLGAQVRGRPDAAGLEPPSTSYSPIKAYKWADTERALENLAQVAADPFDDVALEYTNPHTGRPVMNSFTCSIQMLRPGVHTAAHRHTGSWVYLAFEGHGETVIDGIRFSWGPGDMFVLPSWATHQHVKLFITGRPVCGFVYTSATSSNGSAATWRGSPTRARCRP